MGYAQTKQEIFWRLPKICVHVIDACISGYKHELKLK